MVVTFRHPEEVKMNEAIPLHRTGCRFVLMPSKRSLGCSVVHHPAAGWGRGDAGAKIDFANAGHEFAKLISVALGETRPLAYSLEFRSRYVGCNTSSPSVLRQKV